MSAHRTEDGCYILCPYCALALSGEVEARRLACWRAGSGGPVPCNNCGLDVTRDAPSEEPIAACAKRAFVTCRFCDNDIVEDALRCAACRRWQEASGEIQRAENASIDRGGPPESHL